MKVGTALMVLGMLTPALLAALPARAQPVEISCADFKRRPDGSWTPIRRTTIVGPNGPFTVEAGQVFRHQLQGTTNYGVKIAEVLDDRCR